MNKNQRAALLRRDAGVPGGLGRARRRQHHATGSPVDNRPDEKHRRGADTRVPQHAPTTGGNRHGRENRGRELTHRNPGGRQSDHQRQRTLAGIGIGKRRAADGEHREGDAFQAAGRQHHPADVRRRQRQRIAEDHQRQGPEDQRRSPVTLNGAPHGYGKEQAEQRVYGHEATGESPVVGIIRQQHRQNHR